MSLLLVTAVRSTTTTSACAGTARDGRPCDHPAFGQRLYCSWRPSVAPPRLRPVSVLLTTAVCSTTTTSARWQGPWWPSVQPPRLRPVPGLPITAVRTTTTASACAGIAHHGRPCSHHDFGLCSDCQWRPTATPPRLRPLRLLPITAIRTTTTTSACARIPRRGRLCNHHDFGLCRNC